MDKLLIVAENEKTCEYFSDLTEEFKIDKMVFAQNSKTARDILQNEEFDLHIIICPLRNGTGVSLARDISRDKTNQIILLINKDVYEETEKKLRPLGILVLPKPLNKVIFRNILKTVEAALIRTEKIIAENKSLNEKLEIVRLVDRAKCILIEYLKMTEHEAHRFIEKQAMDLRVDKKTIARDILKTYETPQSIEQ